MLKLYILIKNTCPDNVAPLIAAHATMGVYNKFKDRDLMKAWATSKSFAKVVCKVTPEQFDQAKAYGEFNTITENRHQHLGEIGMAFDIQKDYPKFLKYLQLWKVG